MGAAFSRRAVLGGLSAVSLLPARAAPPPGLAAAAPMIDPALANRALAALFRHHAAIWSRDVIAIADFGLPSALPRLFLVDIVSSMTASLFVTHGKGSDPNHTGMLQSFSDEVGSAATAEGAYLTGDAYVGAHGPSRRLIGLDPSNRHAEERAIVIHSAWYAAPGSPRARAGSGAATAALPSANRISPWCSPGSGAGACSMPDAVLARRCGARAALLKPLGCCASPNSSYRSIIRPKRCPPRSSPGSA